MKKAPVSCIWQLLATQLWLIQWLWRMNESAVDSRPVCLLHPVLSGLNKPQQWQEHLTRFETTIHTWINKSSLCYNLLPYNTLVFSRQRSRLLPQKVTNDLPPTFSVSGGSELKQTLMLNSYFPHLYVLEGALLPPFINLSLISFAFYV